MLAQVAALLSGLGLRITADLEEFAKRPNPHRLAAKLISRDGDGEKPYRMSLSAFELAVAAHEWKTSVRELTAALEDLAFCGVDVADARRFGNWLAANPQAPSAQASPVA